MFGVGDQTNHVEAVKWYEKAAKQGCPLAMFRLGCCYKRGLGVEKDLYKAVDLCCRAAQYGNDEAKAAHEKIVESARREGVTVPWVGNWMKWNKPLPEQIKMWKEESKQERRIAI